jgi:hypothetical protein
MRIQNRLEEWSKHPKVIDFMYNIASIGTFKKSPFELIYGRISIIPVKGELLNEDANLISAQEIDIGEMGENSFKASVS